MALPYPSFVLLFAALFLLALAPNLGILIVTTRAASAGLRQGVWASTGIAAATAIQVLIAVFVLAIVSWMRPEPRQVLRVVAAVWLVWNGMVMIRNASIPPRAVLPRTGHHVASFATGFFLTVLNPKSIVFYVCFLPAFVAAGRLGPGGTAAVVLVAMAAGLAARLLYAAASARGRAVPGVTTGRVLNVIAGAVVAAAGARLVTG